MKREEIGREKVKREEIGREKVKREEIGREKVRREEIGREKLLAVKESQICVMRFRIEKSTKGLN